jgi:hypothetical protein
VKPAGKLPNANALKACAPVYAIVGTIGTNKSGAAVPTDPVADTPDKPPGTTEDVTVPAIVVLVTPEILPVSKSAMLPTDVLEVTPLIPNKIFGVTVPTDSVDVVPVRASESV